MSKITSDHLQRQAFVYIRQSTMGQVHNNRESQRRQYSLTERARHLGWKQVTVIDDDLGRSGSGVHRPGFERLLAALCEGNVGAVFCIEASRLARNGRDWHTLLEFCRLVEGLLLESSESLWGNHAKLDKAHSRTLCRLPDRFGIRGIGLIRLTNYAG